MTPANRWLRSLSLEFEYQYQPKDKLIAGIISIYTAGLPLVRHSMTPMVNLQCASAKDTSDQLTSGVVDSSDEPFKISN
jgi:hypothetical protein